MYQNYPLALIIHTSRKQRMKENQRKERRREREREKKTSGTRSHNCMYIIWHVMNYEVKNIMGRKYNIFPLAKLTEQVLLYIKLL